MNVMSQEVSEALRELLARLDGEEGDVALRKLRVYLDGNDTVPVRVVSFHGEAEWKAEGSDLVYITLPPSQGLAGNEWIDQLEDHDFRLTDEARQALQSADFKPVMPGLVHRIVVLRATFWKNDAERTTPAILSKGGPLGWLQANLDAMCMIRACFSDKQLDRMGFLWIVGIHRPFVVGQQPHLLRLGHLVDAEGRPMGNGRLLAAPAILPLKESWPKNIGFAWSLPQVQS